MIITIRRFRWLLLVIIPGFALGVYGQATDRQIAAQFAPIFYQALGSSPRSDYITNFNFDGDWRGDNNWENAADPKFPLTAYIYYAVSQTRTHYFIHYGVFHPRDYKGGEVRGRVLSNLLGRGAGIVGDRDPTGLLVKATSAHENDMEGALVVAAKNEGDLSKARVQYLETLSHNRFISYAGAESGSNLSRFQTEGQNVLLYIEPRGHGIQAYGADEAQTIEKDIIVYKFTGNAEDPEVKKVGPVGYELLPLETSLWPRARSHALRRGLTYGNIHNYAPVRLQVEGRNGRVSTRTIKIGRLGSTFLGKVGGQNMARPPWGWFDMNRRSDPLGIWFFDPAMVIKRSFDLDESFSTVYSKLPFWAGR